MSTDQKPQKVRVYRISWLKETFYCGKKSEIREWVEMRRAQYAGLMIRAELSEAPLISQVYMWRIRWHGEYEDFRSEYEASEALRGYEARAEIARNPDAYEVVPDPYVGMYTPFLLYGAAMRGPDQKELFGSVNPTSIQAAFVAGRLWRQQSRMNPMEGDCWLDGPVPEQLRLACIHGWLDRDFEYRHETGDRE